MRMLEVSLHVLVWNGERDLPDLVDSLQALTYPALKIRMLDNGSIDGSRAYLQDRVPAWLVARNPKNVGFAAGHNQLISYALHRWEGEDLSQKAIVVVNQDMVLAPDCIERMVEALQTDTTLGAVQPKVLRAFRPRDEHGESSFSDVLDTTGLVLSSHWRMEDRGAGAKDEGQFDERTSLIGPGGAFALYRASALVDVSEQGQCFDEAFFAYREDCDLALRLVRSGWKTLFVPLAKAWHYRGMFGAAQRSLLERLRDRRGQQAFRNAWSLRNQLFFLVKHFPFAAWTAFPAVLFHEGGRVAYAMLFEPETRTLLLRSLPIFKNMRKKRQALARHDRISWQELRGYVQR